MLGVQHVVEHSQNDGMLLEWMIVHGRKERGEKAVD